MDNNFENITPWDGTKDTGRDVRLKWERNFSRVKANFEEVSGKLAAAGIPTVAYQDIDNLTDPLSSPGLYLMDFGDSLPVVCGILEVATTWGMNCVSQKLTGGFHAEDLNGSAEIPTMYGMELHTFVRHMNLSLKPAEWTPWEEYVPDSMDGFLKAVEWPGAVISTFTVTPQGLLDPSGGEVALAVKKGDASLGAGGGEPQGFVLLKGGKVYSVWLEGGGIPSSEYYNAGQGYSGTAAIEWPDGTVYVATGEPWTDLDGWNIGTGLDITHVDRREKAVYIASGGALKKVYGESDVIPRYVEWPGIVADSSVEVMSESVYPSSDSTVALQLGSNGNPWRFLLKTGTVFYNNWAAGTGIDGAIPPATDYQFNGSFLPNTIYRGRGDTLDLLPEGVSLLPECVFFTDSQCAMHKLWQKDEDAEAPVEWKVREWPGGVAEVTSVEPQSVAQPTGEVVLGTTGGVPDGFVLWQDGKFYNNWLDGDGIHGRAYYQEGVIGSAEFFDCTFYTATGAAGRIVNPGAGEITRQAAVYVKDGESGELKKVFANAGGTGGVASIKVGNNEDSLQPDGNGQVAIPLATGTQDGAMSAGEKKSVSKLRETGYTATMGDPSADATTLKLPNTGFYEDINTHEWAEDKQTITLPAATEEKAGVMSAEDKAKLDGTPATVVFGDLVNSGMATGAAADWSYFAPYTSYKEFHAAVVAANTLFYARIQTPDNGLHATLVPAIVCLNEEDFIDITIVYGNYAPCVFHFAIYSNGTCQDLIHKRIALGDDIT